ncbi:zinc finger protein VAR3, chloroplastic isoform X2 [Arachis duranensis]|uniref:Zinc finger protein VAR3, chloroplastic isoform X2 n=1 Tax=Arachis duranensis TaxID=130453 RepID=A0A6P4DXU5_ARADU|nr:zinc finger protein VAR3, chloroplastic isoform X2 [Arachis duranensis]XP_025605574.1 zinc finger protein VAR3, chloroplastic isoform X2 [Arachis hypogaea]
MVGAAPRFLSLLTTAPSPLLRHRRHLLLLSANFRRLSTPFSTFAPSPLKLKPSQHHHHPQPQQQHQQQQRFQTVAAFSPSSDTFPSSVSHPWPEWSRFLSHLTSAGYLHRPPPDLGTFAPPPELSRQFVAEAAACYAFAADRPNLLRLLSKRDIGVVAENGVPFLFRDAKESIAKMKAFVSTNDAAVLDTDRATTVDLMKFMLSYASNPLVTSESNNLSNRDIVESSVRNLFGELYKLSYSAPGPNSSDSMQNQISSGYGQTMPPGRNIEMKRGDWICPRCNFMNFARNVKCRECEEARPKRQLTGGEWECPQCDFYNYGRNMTCLRCDCKRPGQISLGPANTLSNMGYGNGDNTNTSEIDSRLAANEEKARRWFSKVSQLDSSADINSLIGDEDFPEIMPLRKGVNRFVVSTRKTPLERRLADARYRRNLDNNGIPGVEDFKSVESTRINDPRLSSDLAAQKIENMTTEKSETDAQYAGTSTDSSSRVSDENFPEVMPMRTGENRFVVSKKKDRSLTSPAYKRQLAMEQSGNNTNFVPFVPFPPDYFAKKDKQPENGVDSVDISSNAESSSISEAAENPPKMPDDARARAELRGANYSPGLTNAETMSGVPEMLDNATLGRERKENVREIRRQDENMKNSSLEPSGQHSTKNDIGSISGALTSGNSSFNQENFGNKNSNQEPNLTGSLENQNNRTQWTGKSLEGSAVKEPDPLDMSEEAKAERWFRRVAQIKDISELSQIPDEDFPSIMPMRKGVNRFVVSKRKTPLERRLTSQQYRRNLPVVSSDPLKKENEGS